MITGITSMRAVERGTGPQALATGEDEAGAQGEGRTGVQLGKEVKRDVPKLSNGTGKGNKLNKLIRTTLITPTIIMKAMTMVSYQMEISTMETNSSHNMEDMDIDPINISWCVFLLSYK